MYVVVLHNIMMFERWKMSLYAYVPYHYKDKYFAFGYVYFALFRLPFFSLKQIVIHYKILKKLTCKEYNNIYIKNKF